MNAVLRRTAPERRLLDLATGHLDAVLAVEAAAYDFPWSRGNFVDSLAAGYPAQLLLGAGDDVIGYFVAMLGAGEVHLLNLTVAPGRQGRGHARFLLDRLVERCCAARAGTLWLEVRHGNARARQLYLRYGFRHIGLRRNYYPAPHGRREDAVVLCLDLSGQPMPVGDALV